MFHSRQAQAMLQCGHDPKAVENPEDQYQEALATLLQCGHDPKAGESYCYARAIAGRFYASMRPRPEGRGERAFRPKGRASKALASMRPRPEGRGERRTSPPWRPRSTRFNAATTRRPWRTGRRGRL